MKNTIKKKCRYYNINNFLTGKNYSGKNNKTYNIKIIFQKYIFG